MLINTLLNATATPWLVCALIALSAEFLTGSLYLLVFAIAFTAGGINAFFDPSRTRPFIVASIVALIAFSALFYWKRRHPPKTCQSIDDPDIGQTVHILSIDNADPNLARVSYRGAIWDARLIPPSPSTGQTGYIIGRNGNLLHISLHPQEG